MYAEVTLTKGQVALIDEYDDDCFLRSHYWYASYQRDTGTYVAMTNIGEYPHQHSLSMHRFILDALPGEQVDHINHDTLDNRRSNLRLCTPCENTCNRGIPKNNTTGYKGVRLDKRTGHWESNIKYQGKRYNLGSYLTPEEASKAYDTAAMILHGGFALTNEQIGAVVNPELRELSKNIMNRPMKHRRRRRSKSWLAGHGDVGQTAT